MTDKSYKNRRRDTGKTFKRDTQENVMMEEEIGLMSNKPRISGNREKLGRGKENSPLKPLERAWH